MKLYLAHPFDTRFCVRFNELWFERKTGIELVNPFYDLQREDMEKLDDPRTCRDARSAIIDDFRSLVDRDLAALRNCEGVVVFLPDDVRAIGTICEAWDAYVLMLPIYFVCGTHTATHPWIKFMAYETGGRIFANWAKLSDFWYVRTRENLISLEKFSKPEKKYEGWDKV